MEESGPVLAPIKAQMTGNSRLTAIIVTSSVALFVYHDIPTVFCVDTTPASDKARASSVRANKILKLGIFLPKVLRDMPVGTKSAPTYIYFWVECDIHDGKCGIFSTRECGC